MIFCFVCFICVLLSPAYSVDIMSALWNEDLDKIIGTVRASDEEKTLLIKRLSQVPFTDKIKSEAWHKLSKYHPIQMLRGNDWKVYEALIPFLPDELINQVNFSDDFTLRFFGEQKLNDVQMSMISEKLHHLYGSNILKDEENILRMGNIFCGFPDESIQTLRSATLRSLLKKRFFTKLHGCSLDKLNFIKKEIQHSTIVGRPRTWQPETIDSLGTLIAALNYHEVREIRKSSFSKITPAIIELIPVSVLKKFRRDQLEVLNRSSLLTWRRKTKDLKPIYFSHGSDLTSFVAVTAFGFAIHVL